jgi:hypothetical protein
VLASGTPPVYAHPAAINQRMPQAGATPIEDIGREHQSELRQIVRE